ncbi:hypothetical protein CRI94_17125 [Longibacter salinarum]|uniref:Uncharacterized protein n=1 Tax=Longibacter salinarum TaxID=1850348 RepID=A0A2A8CT78_9BACT|nr:hypothetical protein [Longibacter salinarum]PEN10950.1 hypothetical protein CRI94_17125 [Longibacter salinarum]
MRIAASLVVTSLLVLGILGFNGCVDAPEPQAERSTQDQRVIDQLQSWNQRLVVSGRQKDDRLRSMTRLVHKMMDDLAGVANGEGLVRGVRVDQPVHLEAEFPRTERSIRAAERQFLSYLSVLESSLQEGEQRVERSHDPEDEARVSDLRQAITELREKLDASARRADGRASRIDSLAAVVLALRTERDRLISKNESLSSSARSLRRAYVIAETQDVLLEKEVIDNRFLRSPVLKHLHPDLFETTTVDATVIPFDGTSAEVISPHQYAPDTFTIEPGRVRIHDPEGFWALSRYVVIKVDP